jgi:hypothetical protein
MNDVTFLFLRRYLRERELPKVTDSALIVTKQPKLRVKQTYLERAEGLRNLLGRKPGNLHASAAHFRSFRR